MTGEKGRGVESGGASRVVDISSADPIAFVSKSPVPWCDRLQPSDYRSIAGAPGMTFEVFQVKSDELRWELHIVPTWQRANMENNVRTVDVATNKEIYSDARPGAVFGRQPRIRNPYDGSWNHGAVNPFNSKKPKIARGKIYRIEARYAGNNGPRFGPLALGFFGNNDQVFGIAMVTCRCS